MGLVPWSPLTGGFLTGKCGREDKREGNERLNGGNPLGSSKFTDRNWLILDALKAAAADIGCPPARAALVWTINRPRVDALSAPAGRSRSARTSPRCS